MSNAAKPDALALRDESPAHIIEVIARAANDPAVNVEKPVFT